MSLMHPVRSFRLTKKLVRWLMWRLSLPLLVLNGWCLLLLFEYFKTPITILIIGTIAAFLLEYPVRWLERLRVQRGLAILIVLLSALLATAVLGIIIIPLLIKQANQLADSLSDWATTGEQQIQALHNWAIVQGIPIDLSSITSNFTNHLSSQAQAIVGKIPVFLGVAVGGVFETVLITVVTLYLLLKGDRLWKGIFEWLPPRLGNRIQNSLPRSFRNYFIGQGTVAVLLGTLMSITFTLFHVPFGFLFGAFIGLMALFPYGGSVSIAIVTILLSLKSIGLGITVLILATIVDQIVENGVAPRLLGKLTGVHPVWVVLTLMIGGKIAGVLGFILAVPLASFGKEILEPYKPKRIEEPPNLIP